MMLKNKNSAVNAICNWDAKPTFVSVSDYELRLLRYFHRNCKQNGKGKATNRFSFTFIVNSYHSIIIQSEKASASHKCSQ